MRWPVESPVVSSPFDPHRRHPVLGYVRPHNGTDFCWKSGVQLFVIADGVVAGRGVWNSKTRTPEGGNWVSIDFTVAGQRYRAVYMHMESPSPLRVGQSVTEGMSAGVMGATGLVDGKHLHFEIRVMPADTPIDPELFLRGGSTAGTETPNEDDMTPDQAASLARIEAALFQPTGNGAGYFKTDAMIGILRGELGAAIASIAAGGILFPGAKYNAFAALANKSGSTPVDVDEQAIAAALAPLLIGHLGALPEGQVQAIAKASADELARRLAS